MKDVLDFTFSAKLDAELALSQADRAHEAPPTGAQIIQINLNQGMQEPDPNGPFWMVTDESGEWMVNRDGEWECVA